MNRLRYRHRKRSICVICGRPLRVDGLALCRRCRLSDTRLPPLDEPPFPRPAARNAG